MTNQVALCLPPPPNDSVNVDFMQEIARTNYVLCSHNPTDMKEANAGK